MSSIIYETATISLELEEERNIMTAASIYLFPEYVWWLKVLGKSVGGENAKVSEIMRWSGKKYVRRYHKSLNIAKALEKKVTGENYVWYSVRALHVTLLVLLFSLFIFSFISPLIWVGLGWNFHRWFSIHQSSKMMNNLPWSLSSFAQANTVTQYL